jgi:pyruvate-formate lyase-activating enzyme
MLPVLSPFVPTMAAPVEEALLALLGVARERAVKVELSTLPGAGTDWIGTVTVADAAGDFLVEVFDATARRDTWFRSARFGFAYRAGAGRDPFATPSSAAALRAMRERLSALDGAAASPEASALLDALALWRPFSAVGDGAYRHLLRGPDGATGLLWLGFACNQDCDVCWQGRSWPAPPDETILRWLDEMVAAGAGSVVLSGGEPTLHPLLPELLRRARAAGAHTVLETNGLRLVEAPFRAALVAAGLGEVVVSLHAADSALSDAITRAPGTFVRTVEAIEACVRDRIPVGIHCVVEERNHRALEMHARFVGERLAGVRRVSYSFPTRYFDGALYRRSIPSLDAVRPSLTAAVRALRSAHVEPRFLGMSGFPLCVLDESEARAELARRPDRDLTDDERGDLRYARPCESCAARRRCHGVPPAYLDAHGDRGLRPLA